MRRYRRPARPAFSGPREWLLPLVLIAGMAVVVLLLRPVEPPFSGNAFAVDGDTLRIGPERVRLVGIDAPEREQTCTRTNGEVWGCGEAAHGALTALVRGANITCTPQGRDRYGRILAKCKSGDADLGQSIVEQLEIVVGAGTGGGGEALPRVEHRTLRIASHVATHLGAHVGILRRRLEGHHAVLVLLNAKDKRIR